MDRLVLEIWLSGYACLTLTLSSMVMLDTKDNSKYYQFLKKISTCVHSVFLRCGKGRGQSSEDPIALDF